jgi:hypothetical protein
MSGCAVVPTDPNRWTDPETDLEVGHVVFAAERRQAILELVRNSGAMSLRDLAEAVRGAPRRGHS